MAGKKGASGGWNKREEWNFRELLDLSKSELVRLGKKYKSAAGQPGDKHYNKWLDISLALVLKAMPQKMQGEGFEGHKFIVLMGNDANDSAAQAVADGIRTEQR